MWGIVSVVAAVVVIILLLQSLDVLDHFKNRLTGNSPASVEQRLAELEQRMDRLERGKREA